MPDITTLYSLTAGYLHDVDLEPLNKAYAFAVERHGKRRHESGELYITHLLEVAFSLAAMELDLDTIIAGLLHGTLKDGVASLEELEKLFGHDIAHLVEGVTKVPRFQYNSKLAHQAENIRKLLLAMSTDIRVLLLKLADRLQDMASLEEVDGELRRQKARETMDLYAPLASRLGIDWLKRELEDLSFKYLYPEEYAELDGLLQSTLDERQAYVDEVLKILAIKLRQNSINPIQVIGRPKRIYSIYKKLVAQQIPLEKVYDKVAFRIITRTVEECYAALDTVHREWRPVSGRIKDFITSPKSNNYQSLHTTVAGPHGHFIEIQIRTEEMDKIAQEGVAAHWAYKEGQEISERDARLFKGLKNLVHNLQAVEDPGEFMDSVRAELFEPDVYALTPTGEVRELPSGSTPIDFAYSIHTAVGDTCIGAKVNGQMVQLKHELQSGDIVEILTQKQQHPKRAWLQFVKTGRAKTRIRQWLRKQERERFLKLGREICERELKKYDVSFRGLLKGGHLRLLLKELRVNSLEDLLEKVGSGALTVFQLIKTLQPEEFREKEERRREEELLERTRRAEQGKECKEKRQGVDIDGVDDMLVKVCRCCRPIPGDEIMGFITTGSGISIHKTDCPHLRSSDPARWIDVSWSGTHKGEHRAGIVIRAENNKRLLGNISSAINADDATILEIHTRTARDNVVEMTVLIEVTNRTHLQSLMRHLRQFPEVMEVRRT
ncbi:MAG: GTP pyrophosphokinase [Desulfobulbus propionicus]|nr:MAG: GTP pyrophosphokinase [Desulfobulbus propionicus]